MKRAFVLEAGGRLVSALVPLMTADVLRVGLRITVSHPLDLGYAAQITAGEQGTVDAVDADTGFTEILMDEHHHGLTPWRNHIWLEPFGTDDILGGIVLHSAPALKRVA